MPEIKARLSMRHIIVALVGISMLAVLVIRNPDSGDNTPDSPDALRNTGMSDSGLDTPDTDSELQRVQQGLVDLTFEAPLTDLARADTQADDSLNHPNAGSDPGPGFALESYSMTTREIFRGFWSEALNWTSADFYQELGSAASLSGQETYQVYVYLRTCLDGPRSQQELDRSIARLERSGLSPKRLATRTQQRIESLIRCEGLEELDLNLLALDWLTSAADRGYPQAQVAYYKSPRWLLGRSENSVFKNPDLAFQWRERTSSYLHSAVRSGHPDAFVEFSDAVRDDILFRVDLVESYGYAYAADLASNGSHREAREILSRLQMRLTAADVRQGRELGRSLCEQYCVEY